MFGNVTYPFARGALHVWEEGSAITIRAGQTAGAARGATGPATVRGDAMTHTARVVGNVADGGRPTASSTTVMAEAVNLGNPLHAGRLSAGQRKIPSLPGLGNEPYTRRGNVPKAG